MIRRRDARLELAATLRHPLPLEDAEALVALLSGRAPRRTPDHALFRHPEATQLLTGESLDHATSGARIVQEDGAVRLLVSSSLPPCPVLLAAGLSWLGSILRLEAGEVPGFVVPAGAPRHDLQLLVWDGTRLRPLPEGAAEPPLAPRCSLESFAAAAGLPGWGEAPGILRAALRRAALAQVEGRCLPVAQARLDGPFGERQGMFRLWMARALWQLDGLGTAAPPLTLRAA
ncbi:hypothetical protein IBL26_12800 [Roseomonas aerophila]|uniref:Uncharacterized protein n=1 Tax=Teichococcus aerophilus TaxID=1224513 RepID=A0ABR7RN46_9PROT|nr:hypothetical protein [Pseudoroseomonas aerophila]MBC9207716.1 hypothetical protein [Pseudoroseomonas aerophila]